MRNFWKISAALFVAATMVGCVTHKKKSDQKVGWFKKGYHNMTSHYNYWFNANELMNTAIAKMDEAHKDNYNQILDVYPYAADDPQAIKGDMDNVIAKTSKAITIHRVSDWTDDCYLLLAQAQHLKMDFETAEASFLFIKEELDPHKKLPKTKLKKDSKKKDTKKSSSKKKKKKKKSSKKKKTSKDKPKEAAKPVEPAPLLGDNPYGNSVFKRTSAWPEAMIWYGRTLTERDKFEEADYHYQQMWEDPFLPNKLRDDLATAEAYNWMKQKRYDRAIGPLTRAIELTRRKKDRARLSYILAQLYDRAGKHEEAYAAFDRVLRSAPTFEMEFNARLQQIESGWENGKITAKEADKTLNRMASEDKNADYRDQVYFTLATIALKENQKKEAIAYLRQSLDHSKGNASQRAESYLKLADLYFEAEEFVQAKNYYDSTLTVLSNTDERYKRVDVYAKNLTDIARLIQSIAANDSIVRVYKMSDGERKDLAKKIKKQREEEAAAAEAEAAKQEKEKPKSAAAPLKTGPVAGQKASSFYFYNETFVKKGKKDFSKTWGDRKREDNWRRNSRRPNQDATDDVAAADSTKANDVSEADLSDIFQGIPKSEEELAVIHLATYEAMYQLGTLFRDKLENNRRCTGTLEEMLTRYPDTVKYEKEAWYYCHIGFKDLENREKAQEYYDKLVEKYPNSSYARAISDANFLNAQKLREKELNDYYQTAYTEFKRGQYQSAFDKCQNAPQKFGSQNAIMSKFALLAALCMGNLQGKDAYCGALSDVIGRFPETAEATRAKEIARLLSCRGFEVSEVPKKDASDIDEAFTLEDDKLHYFLAAIDNADGSVKLDNVKAAVSDYNREFHKTEQLRISNIFLGTDTQLPIIVLRKFDNREAAMKFLREVEKKPDFLGETAKRQYEKELFIITQENYRRVLKNKTLDGYREFFEENYRN